MNKITWNRAKPYVMSLAGGLFFLLLWQVSATLANVRYFPTFTSSVQALLSPSVQERILIDIRDSVLRVGGGFFLAAITGIPLGILIGRWQVVHQFTKPLIQAVRFVPPLALVPIALVLFGVQPTPTFIIWFAAFFPILLSTVTGVQRTDLAHIDVVKSFGGSEWQILEKVMLPSAVPEILTGARLGLGVGWMSVVAAEMVAAGWGTGLGYHLWAKAFPVGQFDLMVGILLLLAIIGFIMNEGFAFLERYLLRYRRPVSR
ncbi:MAG: ABC transporter permease [Promethearchaeota archaeon]